MHSPARAPADSAAQRTSALLEDQPVSPREPAAIAVLVADDPPGGRARDVALIGDGLGLGSYIG